jgi:hypothetical protein
MINLQMLEQVVKEVLEQEDLVVLKKLLKLCLVVVVVKEDFSLILVVRILVKLVLEQEVVLDHKGLVVKENNITNNRIMKNMIMVDKDKEINLKKLI